MYKECKDQSASKIHLFACFVNGKVLKLHWFKDENGQKVNVTGARYRILLESLWSNLVAEGTENEFWFMQDGVAPHTLNTALSYIQDHWGDKVVSRKTTNIWHSHSPDLNPRDSMTWGNAQHEVYKKNPSDINELKRVVESYLHSIPEQVLLKTADNVTKRASACLNAAGGHFQKHFEKEFRTNQIQMEVNEE